MMKELRWLALKVLPSKARCELLQFSAWLPTLMALTNLLVKERRLLLVVLAGEWMHSNFHCLKTCD